MATRVQAVAGAPSGWLESEWISYATVKRWLDIVVSGLALVLTFPLWIAIAVAILLDSGRPVFFVQERVGLHGQRFRCIKFRTMQVDAEARLAEMRRRGEVQGPVYKLRRDPRVTRVGRMLRRTSLDELPQLLNVVKGEMSLVGPRPCIPEHVQEFSPEDQVRQTTKPGLTCLWALRGRSAGTVESWLAADREYVSRQSFWLDAWILLRTVGATLRTGSTGTMTPSPDPVAGAPMGMRASITIPTYNRRALLLQTLASLERQSLPPDRYEVIVAVDGSTDGTVEALEGLRPAYALRWLVQENRGAVAAANAAGRLARHEVLIVLGDDQLASSDLVAAHLQAHHRHGVVLVQGDYPLATGRDRSGASLVYERARRGVMATLREAEPSYWHMWGGNFSLRRQTWLEIGGWDESFREYGGEDTDLGLRVAALGIPFIFEPRARTQHLHAVSAAGFGRHSYSEGRAVVRVARKHHLPLSAFPGAATAGPFDRSFAWGWRRSPRAMEAIGRLLTLALTGTDLMRIPPAQVAAGRLVRRFYRIGGITREQLPTPSPR